MKKKLSFLMVLFLLLGCMVLMWQALTAEGDAYPSLSLRWREPLPSAQVEAFLEDDTSNYSVTLWYEEEGEAFTDFSQVTASAVRYYGRQSAIQRLTFLQGSEPSELETTCGLVSESFARQLWGSIDVVGQAFFWGKETFTVAAVFQGDTALVYLPQTVFSNFCCLELTGGDVAQNPAAAALDFVELAGFTPFAGAVYGQELSGALALCSWLPLAVYGIWGFLQLKKQFPIKRRWLRLVTLWGGIFLLALFLPLGIGQLPGWLTPPRWSDFQFWHELWDAAGVRLQEWFQIVPWTKDVLARETLLKWLLGWAGSLFCLNWLCFRVGAAMEKA